MQTRTSWSGYAFCLLNRDCQQAAHNVSVITLTICLYGIWIPLKHNYGFTLLKREEFLGTTPLILMFTFYISSACLLYYGSMKKISEFYLPFILVHVGKTLHDFFEIIKALSHTLHYLRLTLNDKSISELIYFPTKLEWNYQSTAYEKFRIVGFISAEIIIRIYAVCIVWRAWYFIQTEREKMQPDTERSDIESGSPLSEDQLTEQIEDVKLVERKEFERF